jgi:hypothetical protein
MYMINPILLPAFFLILSSFCFSGASKVVRNAGTGKDMVNHIQLYDDVLVGQRMGENTAQLLITRSAIQQTIITPVPELNGVSVTDDPISIKINKITSYLIFNVNNANGKKITVALELIQNSNDLVFRAKSGREMHICKSNGNCNSCEFIFDAARIIACTCNSGNMDSVNTNCQHRGILSK